MCDFVTCLPSLEGARVPSLMGAARLFSSRLQADTTLPYLTARLDDAPVVRSRSSGHEPRFFASPRGDGWLLVKGIIFDVTSTQADVCLPDVFEEFRRHGAIDLSRYEGAFVLLAALGCAAADRRCDGHCPFDALDAVPLEQSPAQRD